MLRVIAFATDAGHADLTDDDRIAAEHLVAHGHQVVPACWDDDSVDWTSFAAIVIRSCWDYHLRPREWNAWLDRLQGCRVFNSVATVRWNSRKTYLEELTGAGFAVVPTVFLRRGSAARLDELMNQLGSDELIIKPTIGASAYGLWAARRGDQDRLDAALVENELMAQPRLREIETHGEWSVVYFGGRYSHAVNKRPAAGDFRVQEELGGTPRPGEPPDAVRQAADALVGWLRETPLYVRVDLVEFDGHGVLMELELVEPFLYFDATPRAADAFRDALEVALQ